jgi:hypothetical protein
MRKPLTLPQSQEKQRRVEKFEIRNQKFEAFAGPVVQVLGRGSRMLFLAN